jgi:hypothetical protein
MNIKSQRERLTVVSALNFSNTDLLSTVTSWVIPKSRGRFVSDPMTSRRTPRLKLFVAELTGVTGF